MEWSPEINFWIRYTLDRQKYWLYFEKFLPKRYRDCDSPRHWDRTCGVFCRSYHAAFSSACHCWSPPRHLFLACQTQREEAQAIFFAKNRFIVTPGREFQESPATSSSERLSCSTFLTDIVSSNALQFLRFLELVFPPFENDYLRRDEPAYQDWLRTIDHVKDKLNLPLLILRVCMADYRPDGTPGSLIRFRYNATSETKSQVIRMYIHTLRSLSQLKGLKRFFTIVAWPTRWTAKGQAICPVHIDSPRRATLENSTSNLEDRLERMVIGDDYDSTLLGKYKHKLSGWLDEQYYLLG